MKVNFLFTIITLFFSGLAMALEKLPEYNRAVCDSVINPQSYIVKGSLDDTRASGKTYSLARISSALENELLGGQEPNKKKFDCLSSFFIKAKGDAAEYWGQRGASAGCLASDLSVPKVKPESCSQKDWVDFIASDNDIAAADFKVNSLAKKCADRDGKSCDAMGTLKGLGNFAEPLAASKMDECCAQKTGSAFRVLRSFYTVEFGRLNDADLQKECYKRTRPNTDGVMSNIGSGAWQCVKSLATGIAESIMKTFRTVQSLLDFGMWTEIAKMFFTDLPGVIKKIGAFIMGMFDQMAAQVDAASCFSGPYKADQACKLIASLATDFATPMFIVKVLVPILKAPLSAVGNMGKKYVESSPRAQAVAATITKTARTIKPKNLTVKGAVMTHMSSAAAGMAGRLGALNRGFGRFSDRVKDSATRFRETAGQKIAGKTPEGTPRLVKAEPNAQIEVAATRAPAAKGGSSTGASASAGGTSTVSAASGAAIKGTRLTQKTALRLQEKLKPFETKPTGKRGGQDAYKALMDNPNLISKNAKKPGTQNRLLESAAERRRAEVAKLENSSGAGRITRSQAAQYNRGIDQALSEARQYLRLPNPKPKAVASAEGSSTTRPGSSGSRAGETSPGAGPAGGPTVLGEGAPTGVVGRTSNYTPSDVVAKATRPDEFKPFIDNVNVSSFSQNLDSLPKSAQAAASSLETFTKGVQSTFTQSGVGASAMRQGVYGNKGYWSVSRQSVRQHNNVEELLKHGKINQTLADDLHHMIESAERIASNIGRGTSFNGARVVSPNAGPGMFTRLANGTLSNRDAALVATVGAGMSSAQFYRYSDGGAKGEKYEADTITQAEQVMNKLSASPAAMKKEFDDLKTEEDVYDKSDELRLKIKVVAANTSKTGLEEKKAEIERLLAELTKERNLALARITGKSETTVAPDADKKADAMAGAAEAAERAAAAAATPKVAPAKAPASDPADRDPVEEPADTDPDDEPQEQAVPVGGGKGF